ncbi:MAG: cell division/cell wall cluster transcriptional repressor MraZ [Candidatus Levybacteria bacterium]|nr:cell division/cell wall cluster transcriptional repressor MraZ [Candidatus Levybacteria bacterium]
MLIGQFLIKAGSSGRIAFPKRFRGELGDRIIVTRGFEGAIMVVSEKNWKALLEGTEDKPFLLSRARDTQRYLLGGATVVDLDSQGRFVIPEYLREFAQITGEVVAIGLYRYAEIWDKKRWDVYQKNAEKNIASIAEGLIENIGNGK